MKRSIRFRFTTLFIGMLAAVLLAIWVINSFFWSSTISMIR